MSLRPIDAFCDGCGHSFTAVPKRSFLGFQLLTCPACETEVRYPLTSGYRTFYWISAFSMSVTFVGGLAFGHIALPGFIGGAMIAGLIKDRYVRKELAEAAAERAALASQTHHSLPG